MKRFAPLIAVAFVSLITPAFGEMNIDVVVDGLNNPWEMVFAPNGDIYFSERDGRVWKIENFGEAKVCLLYTSPSPRDATLSRMPSSA